MKKRNLLFAFAASALLLTSCGKVTAQFLDGDSPLTNAPITLDHNTLNVIYDAIRNSDNYESDVSSILISSLAKQVIGDFEVVSDETSQYGYKIVLNGYEINDEGKETTEAEKQEWIKNHPAYNNWDYSGYRLTLDTESPSIEDFETRLTSVKNLIDSQIVSSIWTEANATDYKRNNRFYEVLYARNIYEQLYDITIPESYLNGAKLTDVLYENPTYDNHYLEDNGEFNGFDTLEPNTEKALFHGLTNGVLIDGKYNTTSTTGLANIKTVLHINYYLDYINATVIPTIVENLLVEQYIFEQQYSAIGNTQSRKVNYITIADNSEKDATDFVTQFVNEYITFSASGSNANSSLTTDEKFDIASNAWKGVYSDIKDNASTKALADANFGQAIDDNPSYGLNGHQGDNVAQNYESYYQTYATKEANDEYFTYYDNTEYANLIQQYSTLANDNATNNSTNYDTFTTIDSLNYDPIVGFTIKTDAIRVEDFTTSGWQTRDSSSLPDAIKNKLYSFGLVSEWNNSLEDDGQYVGSYIYQDPVTGKSYLKTDSYSSTAQSIIWQDSDSYYIVEIEDIITPNLVAISSDENKDEKESRENKARVAGYTLASGDTYRTNAITYYLEQCNINYHDQDVYDYFVSNYPDLFD